jgi:plastocyanin
MLRHRTLRLAAAFTAVLALTACAQASRVKPSAHATPVNVPTFAPTVNPAPTTNAPAPTGSEAPTATASSAAPGGPSVTALPANKFEPASLTVKVGDKVTWTAQGFHSANSGVPPTVDPAGPIQAAPGFTTYSVTFKTKGTYKYFCQPHASLGMVGEIVVT